MALLFLRYRPAILLPAFFVFLVGLDRSGCGDAQNPAVGVGQQAMTASDVTSNLVDQQGSPPPISQTTDPPGAVSVSLSWDPIPSQGFMGYFVHYGRSSPYSFGSCAYENHIFSIFPSATVPGLAPNTLYFFAVSAFNGLESLCSVEISTVTPSL